MDVHVSVLGYSQYGFCDITPILHWVTVSHTFHKHSQDFHKRTKRYLFFLLSLQQYPEDPAEFKPLTEDE